jgi:hypothetical protein
MISPNRIPDLPTDLAGAGVVNSGDASMGNTKNPNRIETPKPPRKDSSTTVQNACVTGETDPSNHANAVVMTTSDSTIDNQRPEERKDCSPPALITPVPKVIDLNPTLHSLPEQQNVSTPAPIASAVGVTDAGNNSITTISGPADVVVMTTSDSMIDNQRPEERKVFSSPALITPVLEVIDHNPTPHSLPEQKNVSTPAPIPSAAGVTDAGNNSITTISGPADAVVITTSDSMIDNQRPEERKDFSSPALITPVPKVIDHNPTLHSLPEQKDNSTPAPIPSAAGVTDAGNNAITTISGPIISDDPDLLHKTAPAQISSAPKVDSGKRVNVTAEAMPNPRSVVNPTPDSPDLLKSNLGQKKPNLYSQSFIPFVTESTSKLPLESTSRNVSYLSHGEDTSGNNSSDRVNLDNSGAASHNDSHNAGGNVDTGTAKTLPAQPSVTNVAGNKSPDNDNIGLGSTISGVGDHISETTRPSSSNAGHPIATTSHPFSDSNVHSADVKFGSKVKGISDKVGGLFTRFVNSHAVDDSSCQDKNENVNRGRWSPAIGGPKRKKTIPAKVG